MPPPGLDSKASVPPSSASTLPHADDAERVVAHAAFGEPASVVLDDRSDTAGATRHDHAHVLRLGVLHDVRQRLLHEPVERRLDLGRQALAAEIRLDLGRDAASLGERLAEPLERGGEAEVVQRGRPQLDREPPHVLERADDQLSQLGLGLLGLVVRLRRADSLQSEEDRGERLAGLVVVYAMPRTAEVIVVAPGFRMPRIAMHRCSHSMHDDARRAA